MFKNKLGLTLLTVLPLTILSGCAVQPEPVDQKEILDFVNFDEKHIYASQEPLTGTLTLNEAMARALKYNLQNRVKRMEQAVASQSLELAKLDMLPSLGFSAGYFDRNNYNAASSYSVLTGEQSLEPSTSQDKEHFVSDIRLTWNILDFGVSYLQAKQDADQLLISERTRKNVMLNLLQQVRKAYWRTAAMQKLNNSIDRILLRVDNSLEDLKKIRQQNLKSPLTTLYDIRVLVETKQQLEQIKEMVSIGKIELATLINSPPGSDFQLEIKNSFTALPDISSDINSLELTALLNSSLYINEIYNVRIDQLESRKALMRLLPGIEFSYGGYHDNNSFLWNNQWKEAGVRLTGDLMKIFSYNDIKEYGEISEQVAVSRRLAMNMAVVAKLHLSWQAYKNALSRQEHTKYLSEIDNEISIITKTAQSNYVGNGVEVIQNEFRAFRSEMSDFLAYADSQDAFGVFLVSLGLNPIPDNYQKLSISELSQLISDKYAVWESGQLPLQNRKQLLEEQADSSLISLSAQ